MAKNPKNKDLIGVLIIIGVITVIVTIILMIIGFDYHAIIVGMILGIALALPDKKYLYKVSYTVNGQVVTENIWAANKLEVQNLIYSKYPEQVIENIVIISLSGR